MKQLGLRWKAAASFFPCATVSLRSPRRILRPGVPRDQFIATALAENAAVLDAVSCIRERAARGNRAKFDRMPAKVPDVEPEEQNRLPPPNAD